MKRINRVQRLARREEKDIVKRIFFLSVISIILIFVLLTVGVTALGKFADFLDIFFKGRDTQSEELTLPPPILNNVSDTTSEEKIKVTGFSSAGEKVEIYLDGERNGEVTLESGRFEYEIVLRSGENTISAKTVSGENSSDFSSSVVIVLDKTEPKLEVTSPVADQNFFGDNRVKVEGNTDSDAQVFVNGFLANVNSDGHFDVMIPLVEGENEIDVKALDEAGNSKIEKVKVSFRK